MAAAADGQDVKVNQSKISSGPVRSFLTLDIKRDKLPLLESMRNKVEKNYSVKIITNGCFSSNGKTVSDMQRIRVFGSKGDCKDAGVSLSTFLF